MSMLKKLLDELAARLVEGIGEEMVDGETLATRVQAALAPFDVAVRDAVAEEVGQFITMDPETSVLHKQAIEDAAETEFERARRYSRSLSVVALEVDGYTTIQAALGASAGEVLLRTLVLDCCRGIRTCDIVGRGGDAAFSILLPETSLDGAVRVGERLGKIMRDTPVPVGEGEISYTVCVGVATMDGEDKGGEAILTRAVDALRRARENGSDRVIIARQVSLADAEATIDDLEAEFNKALGSVSVDFVTPDELDE